MDVGHAESHEDFVFGKAYQSLSILDKSLEIDETYIILDYDEANRKAKKNCKILKLSSNFDDLLRKLESLIQDEYPNLFILIIEIKTDETDEIPKSEIFEKLESILVKLDVDRPIILQLTSNNEKSTKFYYKDEQSTQLLEIDKNHRNFEAMLNFPTLLCSILDGKIDNCLNLVLENLLNLKNSTMILKFLRLFDLPEELLDKLVLKCAAYGSKNELLAALDAAFIASVRTLSIDSQNYLSYVINVNQSDISNYPSVLSTAVEHKNTQIIEFLISSCTHLIQQLPFIHQVRISTTALASHQLDVLCDLLDISDFPFPSNFNINQVEHERLDKIFTERTNFECAIKAEVLEQITKFIDNNSSLKVVYNPANSSALKQAVDAQKYKVFYYLKSHGFQAVDVNIEKQLNKKELRKAKRCKSQQMSENVSSALDDSQISVNLLCNHSFIHNKRINKDQETEYRQKIRKWYEDINKILFGSDLLNVAASCKDLKLIFDFEDESVENASLSGPGSLGTTYPQQKLIFIGAKSTNNERDQKIKGVIAHELCHYVMKLVYENNENPYYKHCIDVIERYKAIVTSIDKWSVKKSKSPDDECDGIIFSVFTHYDSKDFHQELIVRVMQILAQYDDNEEKLKCLQFKYNELFEYFRIHVLSEMQKFNLEIRENVQKMNRVMQLLPNIMNRKVDLLKSKAMLMEIFSKEAIVVTTNVPKLLLIDMITQLDGTYGDIFKAQNIFIDPKMLKNEEIFDDLKQLLEQDLDLNIFVDCSKETFGDFEEFVGNKSLKFIFIVSNESQADILIQNIIKKDLNPVTIDTNYSWEDLTAPSQRKLLKIKINFQNNSNLTFKDLLMIKSSDDKSAIDRTTAEDEEKAVQKLTEMIDSEILNLILENSPILLNTKLEVQIVSQKFKFLFQPRDFISRHDIKALSNHQNSTKASKLSQSDLLNQVKDKKYVIISDIAGSGKSWAIKNITTTLNQTNPTKWITYVDLKHFIKEFKTQKIKPEFCKFLVNKILKLQDDKFEAKLFKKMYEIGKVIILFDGFDEIAPNCAELVSKLAQSFEYCEGNQLWIATRDYFEADLQEKLEDAASYKLSSFTDKDGVDFIVKCWMLQDIENDLASINRDDFEKYMKKSDKLEIYHQNARRIINKIVMADTRSVGMPQLFKMIAESFKDNKKATITIKKFKIYKTFAEKLYERWSSAKGEIRHTANTESQDYELNFQKFHQHSALKKLFSDLIDDLFPDIDESEWLDVEVIACGLMTKIGDEFYFLHETFCEFYVADYIAGLLKKKTKFKDAFCELLARVLTIKKFEMVRVFLSDVIDDYSFLKKILEKMKKQIEYFNEMTNFHHYFTKFNEHFGYLVIEALKNGDYIKVRRILFDTAESINARAENSELFIKYQDFMIDFLTVYDLKELIEVQLVFHKNIQSSRNVEIFEDFVIKVEAKTGKEFIKNCLKLKSSDGFEENIFSYLIKSTSLDVNKMFKFMNLIQKYLESTELFKLMNNCNKNHENVLQICIQTADIKKLQIIWTAAEKSLNSSNLIEIIKKVDSRKKSILHNARMINKLDFQEAFLHLLSNSFDNKEELKDFLLQKDFNFIHDLVEKDEEPSIVELTLNILKTYFTASQFQNILLLKHKRDRNLLQMAGFKSKKLQTHQFLWQLYRDSFKDDQDFLDVIKQVDFFGNNIIQIAVYELPNEFFDFMMNELEKLSRPDEIVKILSNINNWNRNVLQSESKWTKSAELHANLWNKFRKYFKSEEILMFIKHVDKFGNHLLFNAVENNKKEFVELIWKDIKSFMSHDEQKNYLKAENNDGKNLLQMSFENKEYFNEVFEWVREVMAEYGIHLETLTRKKLYTEKYPFQRSCRSAKWIH
ncbi:hypothetical protein ACKWTF_014075 [Chironomus riparius]